jgi:hypothetical protein
MIGGKALFTEKDIDDWDKIRKRVLESEDKNSIYVDGKTYRKCV